MAAGSNQPDDLSTLEVLDENTIVHALRGRFMQEKFYTYIGDILVAVNPCKPIQVYSTKYHNDYKHLLLRDTRPPHLFWAADNAFRELRETGKNQVIMVSGESGAGKTESTKYMIRHLMHISPSDDTKLLDKIVQVNPLLEAFGNAATVMNGNSSRFGKFVELSYTENDVLMGAKIDDYILEKSRVVHRSPGEKNFHVFYALFAGMSRERLLYYFLEDPECHRIMRDADPRLGVFRDPEEFQFYKRMFHNLTDIMTEVGFSDEHITLIFLILAAILHLANIVFVPCEDTDGVTVVDEYPLHAVAKLLGIDDEVQLTEALISTINHIKGERIQSWKNLREANDCRDALAKDLYSRLFGWIVGQVNRNLWSCENESVSRGASIGILDMSGFENFPSNGLDQFLINATNEKLQMYFMDYIFPREQRDYEMEGIAWKDILYHSNEDVLNLLFQKPHGIMPLLDEESRFPQSSDYTLVHKLKNYCSTNRRFIPQMGDKVSFGIKHYAEDVTYDANGFLERNRDNLNQDLVSCLLNSNNEFIRDLFSASMSATGSIADFARQCTSRPKLPSAWPSSLDLRKQLKESVSRKASLRIKTNRPRNLSGDTLDSMASARSSPTVTNHFKRSLTDLMEKINLAQPIFVRCVKPNHHLSASKFDSELIRRQLSCNGLMELAQLRRDGYPVRIVFEDFVQRYGILLDDCIYAGDYERAIQILEETGIQGYQVGKTKVFMKSWQKEDLENCRRIKVEEIERIQRERELELERQRLLELEQERLQQLEIERQRIEEENRLAIQRQQEELEELERRRASRDSLSMTSEDTSYISDDHITSTPRKPEENDISGYIRTDDLLKEKLSQLHTNEDGILEGIGGPVKYEDCKLPRYIPTGQDGIPTKRQLSNTSEESKSTTTGSYESEITNDQWRPYDIFQVSEREFEENDAIFKEIMKLVRLVMYVIMFFAILGGAVVNKLSLMLLISGVNKDEESRGEHVTTLLFCICGPLAFNWFMSMMKTLFGGKEWPSVKTFLMLLVLECLQAFGACLIIYRILPSTDMFRGVIISFAVCQIPSLLKVIVRERRPNPSISEIVAIVLNVLAFVVQIGILPFLTTGLILDGNHTILEGVNSTTYEQTPVTIVGHIEWELIVGLLLFSLGYWENYVSGDWTICGKFRVPFKHWRKILQDSRDTVNILVIPWKIGCMILLSRLLTENTDFRLASTATEYDNTTDTVPMDSVEDHFHSYSLMYLQIGSGIVITYLSGLACKLHMQRVAFSFSITLAPPVTLALIYLQCHFEFIPAHWHMGGWFCPGEDISDLFIPLACALALWLSYCITVSHIWFPQSERMAKLEKLFVTPHFDGIFPDFTLTLRRRRNDKEIKLTGFDTFRYVGEESYEEGIYNTKPNVVPQIYACATMWHETRQEMTQLLKSMFRLDYNHCASRLAQEKFKIKDPDYYDFEIHIIFDDAFELNDDVDKFVPNSFVKQLMECMEDAARSVVKGPILISPPTKFVTPYGGRLVWTMPGHTKMVVHVKDKNKIRHRKRWSQCMYMYYLLGYRLFGSGDNEKAFTEETESRISKARNRKKGKSKKDNLSRPVKSLFNKMDSEKYEKAENTFILTLDGDVDFKPESVKLLVDRMKKNRKVGAVCGRIHPIGSGPMVWYQQFEYAVGHWLQKAAEHVFGCVLCCPGCFSLFRGSALMDDNVMKMYTTKPTEARHYIQFEQGEDRWLCTLLLQQGHRIDYCAGADALTFAPETFNEFFNQRRRWAPSTLANMMDLLSSWYDTVRINDNISRPYILYQFILMASTILAPSTIILMITGSYHSVLGLGIWESYLLSILPVGVYITICMTMKNDHQITAAAVLSAIFTVVMMIATVGTIISIVTENFGSPNVVFLTGLVGVFTIAGILHPQEFFCLVYGLLYFLTVPSTFILLTVYYLCNLNNVSWGTRETPKKLSKEEQEEKQKLEEEKKKKKESRSLLNRIGLTKLVNDFRELIQTMVGIKVERKEQKTAASQTEDTKPPTPILKDKPSRFERQISKPVTIFEDLTPSGWEPNPDRPYWVHLEYMGNGSVEKLDEDEIDFWRFIIKKYLHPLDEDKSHKEKIANDLISLKNNVVFIYFMINFLWTIITLQLQTMEDKLKDFYIIKKYEPLSLMFLSVFAFCITLQFVSMFVHRWGTFLHLMSSTRIDWFKNVSTEEDFVRFVVAEAQRLQRMEPAPDYDEMPPDYDDDDDEDDETVTMTSMRESDTHYNQLRETERYAQEQPHEGHRPDRQRSSRKSRHLSSNSRQNDVPILQQIFEDRLDNIHRKWKQGSLAFRNNRPSGRFERSDSHRFSSKFNDMRQRMLKRSFKKNSNGSGYDNGTFQGVVVETL
ncbi:uncharacterized protein LOC132715175 isoform X2 [Ruditapes philippinarum]|uniref:uncharacterized protein LOC132715175 isoform X2 n=1 Tax=Ruditapes philippinarum TaxID=129788 RepID=UPI00295C22FD|nr:uncharacterized protein LOC132715175 isoform X2 [Ruditapes philippinarum]